MLVRMRFSKDENVRFISHLDLMRTFERGFRRARIPVAFSAGFHPRPKISYGPPLPLGLTSSAEYADVELSQPVPADEFAAGLNAELPDGIEVLQAVHLAGPVGSLMAIIDAASYEVFLPPNVSVEGAEVRSLMEKDRLEVTRSRKGNDKKVNIRPLLRTLDVVNRNGSRVLSMVVGTGKAGNARPEEVLSFLPVDAGKARIHRSGLFVTKHGELVSPLEVGNE